MLVTGGRLVIWDITAGTPRPLDYPLPWADQPELSHLATSGQLRAAVETAGFAVSDWNDLTDQAAALMEAILSLPPTPLGLHAFVEDFARKASNLTRGLASGRLRAIQGIALTSAGFQPLDLQVSGLAVDVPAGRGCEWTTIGEVPAGPGAVRIYR